MNATQREEKKQRFYELKQRIEEYHSPKGNSVSKPIAINPKRKTVDDWV